jgi:dihydrodipicolinate synthase/N-acetylneuraminate lyase
MGFRTWSEWPESIDRTLREGTVIPAHLLALDEDRRLDARRQRALTRYYLDASVGGLAVGVHSTQFAIRDVGLYEPVLRLAAETTAEWGKRPTVLVAGVVGSTAQAVAEAETARGLGYHVALVSLGALRGASEDDLVEHCRAVAEVMPVMGFYLQPAVGGIELGAAFWKRFAGIQNVVAVKIAPFNRYRTLDVVRGVVEAGAERRIALYTGNDDHIVLDLVTPLMARRGDEQVALRIRGGLLGHWSVWTRRAVGLHARIRRAVAAGAVNDAILELDSRVTAMNAALFDVAHGFRGCIAGCHEVLRRQGLFEGTWCLDPAETLSPGQAEELDRVTAAWPELTDDAFVGQNLGRWLG